MKQNGLGLTAVVRDGCLRWDAFFLLEDRNYMLHHPVTDASRERIMRLFWEHDTRLVYLGMIGVSMYITRKEDG